MIVKPEIVVAWHRQGFRLYWRWKSRHKCGRPRTDAAVRQLIRRMARENLLWGALRIQSELALLGYTLAESTIAKYMVRAHKPPSQTWRTFLGNHVPNIVAIDFFVGATIRFRSLCARSVARFAVMTIHAVPTIVPRGRVLHRCRKTVQPADSLLRAESFDWSARGDLVHARGPKRDFASQHRESDRRALH